MTKSKTVRLALVGALCATVGAAGGIASSGAAKKSKSSTAKSTTTTQNGARRGPGGPGGAGGPGMHGREVHAEAVVLNKAGTAFITETEDNGTVASVSGDQLAIKEGTKTVTYKTVTVTVPSDATVYRNGKKAALTALKTGDHVHVSQSSDGVLVFADDGTFRPDHDGHGHDGPPPAGSTP
jgi:hypothetical protein